MRFSSGALTVLEIVCAIFFALTIWLSHNFIQQIDLANSMRQINSAGDLLLIALLDAETGQRGYVITGNEAYLVPYYAGVSAVPAKINDLRAFTVSTWGEKEVNEISRLTTKKTDEMAKVIELRRQDVRLATEEINRHLGKNYMDEIRQRLEDMSVWTSSVFSHAEQLGALYARLTFGAALLTLGFGFVNAYPRK